MKIIKVITCFLCVCFFNKSRGQLQVEDEPHHKTIFQNKFLRLLDLKIQPGDTTYYHEHAKASVVVFLTKSALAIQNINEQPVVTNIIPGTVVYRNYDEKPVMHRVWTNDVDDNFRCYVAEIISRNDDSICSINNDSQINLLLKQKLVTAYSINILPKQQYQLKQKNCPALLICIGGYAKLISDKKIRTMRTTNHLYMQPGTSIKILNNYKEKAQFALLQF